MRTIFLTSLAALSLALSSSNLLADSFDISLTTNSAADALVETPITYDGVSAEEYTYTYTTNCTILGGGCTALLGSTTSTFTAIYAALSPTASVLNVNDVCVEAAVLGSAPGCQSFAFSVSNVVLGDGQVGIGAAAGVLALADVNVGAGLAGVTIDGSSATPELLGAGVNGSSDQFDFAPAPTPEPSTLCLMATGALTAAGILRRKARV